MGRANPLVARAGEARQLQPGSSAGRPQHDDLGTGVGHAGDGVQELALQKHSALNLETQADEERRRRVKVGDSDADVVETQ